MTLKIICVTGPSDSGKSNVIREFTAEHLKYQRDKGDVLGVFPMPWRNYAVGVNGYGDNPRVIRDGLEFLKCYDGLSVMILACRSKGKTRQMVESFAKRAKVTPCWIYTERLVENEWAEAISAKVSEIFDLMPGR